MEINIPNGRIIDVPSGLTLMGDPAGVYAVHCLADGYDHVLAAWSLGDPPTPEMDVRLNGRMRPCAPRFLNQGGRGLVIQVILPSDETAYLYVREGLPGLPWRLATKMLALPSDTPAGWGADDAAADQRNGRVLLYVGLAQMNNWF